MKDTGNVLWQGVLMVVAAVFAGFAAWAFSEGASASASVFVAVAVFTGLAALAP